MMNLKHGDIITLENGDTVKVSLEVIKKAITEIVSGKNYRLKRNGNFCHARDTKGKDYSDRLEEFVWQYVGRTKTVSGAIYIFFSEEETLYSMWSTDNLKFVTEEV